MKAYWILFIYISIFRYTVGYPACCSMTESNEEVDIVCRNCDLKVVPNGLPVNTTSLDLSLNNIGTIHNYTFQYLRNLKSLFLNNTHLNIIHRHAFNGLAQLQTLNLYYNSLRGPINDNIFCPLSNLNNLDLRYNLFHLDKVYPENVLACLRNIQSLYIDMFDGFYFGNGFQHLTDLKVIDFLGRGKISITNSSFHGLAQSPVEHLTLRVQVRELQINALAPFQKLQYLTINSEHNIGIKHVLAGLHGLQNKTMESIDIGGNADAYVPGVILNQTDFVYLKTMCVRKLYLYKNGISGVTMNAILSWTSRVCLEIVDFSNNIFITGQLFTLLPIFPALTHVYATNEDILVRRTRRYIHRTQTVFVPHSLLYINISHNSLTGDMANLTFADGNALSIIDVSYPRKYACSGDLLKGLVHVTEFYMSGIDCSKPNLLMFASMKKLTKLMAKYSNFGHNLASDSVSLFKGLNNLSFIDLTANHLTKINEVTFTHQTDSLSTLILAHNGIERVPSRILETMSVLETVDLQHNAIPTLTESERNAVEKLRTRSKSFNMKLLDNPLLCSCEQVKFLLWMLTTEVVSDKNKLTCITGNGDLVEMNAFLETIVSFQEHCESGHWLLVSMILFTFLLTFGVVVYVVRRKTCYWRPWEKVNLIQCEYDVFVAYSHHDSSWFKQYLAPVLESAGITFCCYDLNFEAGKSIVDNIIDAINTSRKVLFLVSYRFIHSDWGTYEIGVASKYAFRDGRKGMNIIIFLDDIKRSEMPKVLRQIWDQVVCLKWPNDNDTTETDRQSVRQRFWKMLKKSLRRGENRYELKNKETAL